MRRIYSPLTDRVHGAEASEDLNGKPKFWLTPPDLYADLNAKFHFDFDPCPFPRPLDFDGLSVPWGQSNYVNPLFRRRDGGQGLTAWARKAVHENEQGKTVVFVTPVSNDFMILFQAGADVLMAERIRFLDTETRKPRGNPGPIGIFVLKGK